MKKLLGDYQGFFTDLLHRVKTLDINITAFPISHLLYRTVTLSEYETLRDRLKSECSDFVETQFNGRAIAILNLNKPLLLSEGLTVSTIELPAPREDQHYLSGFESIGMVVGNELPGFIEKYKHILTGVKNDGKLAFITFDNDKTIKFYHASLNEIVLAQGWTLEKV